MFLLRQYKKHFEILKKKVRQGMTRQEAVTEHIKEQIRRRYSAELSNENLKMLKRKVYPLSKRYRAIKNLADIVFDLERKAKRKLISETFGLHGEHLGMVVIEPELFGQRRKIVTFLRDLGIKTIFTKNLIFTKDQILRTYEDRHLNMPGFPIKASLLLNSPSQLIVFRHLPRQEYIQKSRFLKYLKENNPKEYMHIMDKIKIRSEQGIFDLLFKGSHSEKEPGTMREDITKIFLKNIGLTEVRRSKTAEALDQFGIIRGKYRDLATVILAGIHTPREQDVSDHAVSLLSIQELKRIKQISQKEK